MYHGVIYSAVVRTDRARDRCNRARDRSVGAKYRTDKVTLGYG